MVYTGIVATIALAFDKIDVSQVTGGKATRVDVWASVITTALVISYGFALNLLWGREDSNETDMSSLREKTTVLRGMMEALKQTVSNERRLAGFLNSITGQRLDRLRDLIASVESNEKEMTRDAIQEAIDPTGQLAFVLATLHRFVASHYREGLATQQQLRVAYYEPVDGYLRCIASYDGQQANCIRNPNHELRDEFKLGKQRATNCLAVYCSIAAPRQPVIVQDAIAAHGDQAIPFSFLAENQRNHIQSMVAFCCRHANSDQSPHPVVTLDCSQNGFFRDTSESQEELSRILSELALRVVFEREVSRLFTIMPEELPVSGDQG